MNLELYKFAKRVNSTASPVSGGADYEITLKQSTDILHPSFLLNINPEYYGDYNYIKWNERQYFVDRATIVRDNLMRFDCTVDVLGTYKTYIGNTLAYIDRCADAGYYDSLIEDSAVSQPYNRKAQARTESGTLSNISTAGSFLLRTSGDQSGTTSTIGITTYAVTANELNRILGFLFTSGNFDFLSDASIKSFFNPFQYIIDVQWTPFSTSLFGGNFDNVKLGFWDSGINCRVVTIDSWEDTLTCSIPLGGYDYDDFRSYSSNYTEMTVYVPGCGLYPISPLQFRTSTGAGEITANFLGDVATGELQVELKSGTYTVAVLSGKMSSSVAIGQLAMNTAGITQSATSAIGNLLRLNPLGALGDAIEGVQKAYQPIQSVNGTAGNVASLRKYNKLVVTRNSYGSTDLVTSIAGRPCKKVMQINRLSGYVKCQNASVLMPALQEEVQMVNAYLNGGFFYE